MVSQKNERLRSYQSTGRQHRTVQNIRRGSAYLPHSKSYKFFIKGDSQPTNKAVRKLGVPSKEKDAAPGFKSQVCPRLCPESAVRSHALHRTESSAATSSCS